MISSWAQEEVGLVDLGDERLDARATTLLSALGNRPNLSIPAACGGWAETKAAYRFFQNHKVTFDKVLAPHAERTLERMKEQKRALLVQDTTEIDLTRPEQEVVGAGELDGARRGVLLHVLHALTPEGTPLGTLWAQCLNRSEGVSHAPEAQKRQQRKQRPIEQKESLRWLTGLRQAREAARRLPQTQCICIADSEADIYELFAEPREAGAGEEPVRVDWLVRACQDRALEPDALEPDALEPDASSQADSAPQHLRSQVLATPVLYKLDLLIRGREAKTAVESRPRRQARQTRQAQVEVRAATLTLRPPWRADRTLEPVTVNVVLVHEPKPPGDEVAVEWILVTTLPIGTPEQVSTIVEYYCVRWNIEILFRTLKSGCRVERRRLEHVDRVLPCLGLYLIVAWRTLFVCRMGRECPDADCETIFEPSEWKAVWVAVHHKKPPKKRPRLAEMVHLIAKLGGYIERPKNEPGVQTLWTGLQRMNDLAWAWQAFGPGTKIRDA